AAGTLMVVGLLGTGPMSVRWFSKRMTGIAVSWGMRKSLSAGVLMTVVWSCYVMALLPLLAQPDPRYVVPLAVAFTLGYVAGVVIPLAPAGLGAREVVFFAVLAPSAGATVAVALAVLARVVHTAA